MAREEDFWGKTDEIIFKHGGFIRLDDGEFCYYESEKGDVYFKTNVKIWFEGYDKKHYILLGIRGDIPNGNACDFVQSTFSDMVDVVIEHIILNPITYKHCYADEIKRLHDMVVELTAYWKTVSISDVPNIPKKKKKINPIVRKQIFGEDSYYD